MGSQRRMVAELQLRLTNEITKSEAEYWTITDTFESLGSLGDLMSDTFYDFTQGLPGNLLSRKAYVAELRKILAEATSTVDTLATWLEV